MSISAPFQPDTWSHLGRTQLRRSLFVRSRLDFADDCLVLAILYQIDSKMSSKEASFLGRHKGQQTVAGVVAAYTVADVAGAVAEPV